LNTFAVGLPPSLPFLAVHVQLSVLHIKETLIANNPKDNYVHHLVTEKEISCSEHFQKDILDLIKAFLHD
jgi:hypothetical protein